MKRIMSMIEKLVFLEEKKPSKEMVQLAEKYNMQLALKEWTPWIFTKMIPSPCYFTGKAKVFLFTPSLQGAS